MNIRTLIIDDEAIARQGLRRRLEQAADFTVVGECADGIDAQESIRALSPDVLFLDIRMPELSGLELIERLPQQRPPRVIFVTAYDEFAVRAFAVNALDYLLKPIDDTRFTETLGRIRTALAEGSDSSYAQQISEALARFTRIQPLSDQSRKSDRIAVPLRDRTIILKVADVDWIGASGNYVMIHAGKKQWLLRETISSMDKRLASFGFVRVHRSTLVNADRITEVRTLESGELSVLLSDGMALKLSRHYREALDQVIGRISS